MSTSTTYFSLEGNEQRTEKKAVCSVSAKESGEPVYQVARFNTGVEAGHFVNPQSLYFDEALLSEFDDSRGKNKVTLYKVNQEVFDLYMKFLKTKNSAFLRGAEQAAI